MPDHTDNINLDKLVFDDQNVERRSWSCLGQTCSRSLIVFFSPNFCKTLDFLRLLLPYTFGQDLWRTYSLGGNLVQCSRIHFTFTKFMNKLISIKNRILLSLVGPNDSGKTYLIHEWLKVGTFQPKIDKICFFYQHPQPIYDVLQKKLIILSSFKACTLNLSTLWKITVPSICSFLMIHVQKLATLRSLWTLLPLADTADLVLYTLNTT